MRKALQVDVRSQTEAALVKLTQNRSRLVAGGTGRTSNILSTYSVKGLSIGPGGQEYI